MDINKIPTPVLYVVRQRLSGEDEYDTSFDERISKMTPKQLMERWCGWKLGTDSWGTDIIDIYEALKNIENDKKEDKLIEIRIWAKALLTMTHENSNERKIFNKLLKIIDK